MYPILVGANFLRAAHRPKKMRVLTIIPCTGERTMRCGLVNTARHGDGLCSSTTSAPTHPRALRVLVSGHHSDLVCAQARDELHHTTTCATLLLLPLLLRPQPPPPPPPPPPPRRHLTPHSPKSAKARSATTRAIDSEDVAPGEGALRTCKTLPCSASNTKSSTSTPCSSRACARTLRAHAAAQRNHGQNNKHVAPSAARPRSSSFAAHPAGPGITSSAVIPGMYRASAAHCADTTNERYASATANEK
jgi:hypothetical protein